MKAQNQLVYPTIRRAGDNPPNSLQLRSIIYDEAIQSTQYELLNVTLSLDISRQQLQLSCNIGSGACMYKDSVYRKDCKLRRLSAFLICNLTASF